MDGFSSSSSILGYQGWLFRLTWNPSKLWIPKLMRKAWCHPAMSLELGMRLPKGECLKKTQPVIIHLLQKMCAEVSDSNVSTLEMLQTFGGFWGFLKIPLFWDLSNPLDTRPSWNPWAWRHEIRVGNLGKPRLKSGELKDVVAVWCLGAVEIFQGANMSI